MRNGKRKGANNTLGAPVFFVLVVTPLTKLTWVSGRSWKFSSILLTVLAALTSFLFTSYQTHG